MNQATKEHDVDETMMWWMECSCGFRIGSSDEWFYCPKCATPFTESKREEGREP